MATRKQAAAPRSIPAAPPTETPPPALLDLDDVPPEHRATVTGRLRNGMSREAIADVIAAFLASL